MENTTERNKACMPCRSSHSSCNGERPCQRCTKAGKAHMCQDVERKKRGRPRKNPIDEDKFNIHDDVTDVSPAMEEHGQSGNESPLPPCDERRVRHRGADQPEYGQQQQQEQRPEYGQQQQQQIEGQMGAMLLALQSLQEQLQTFSQRVDEKFAAIDQKFNTIEQSLTFNTPEYLSLLTMPMETEPVPTPIPPAPSIPQEQVYKQIVEHLPFLRDYRALSIGQASLVIDDPEKPYILWRIFEATSRGALILPVTIYANKACCAILGVQQQDLVGKSCRFSLDQHIKEHLTSRSTNMIGDIFPNIITHKNRQQRFCTRNQIFYNQTGNAKWWLSVIDKIEPMQEPHSAGALITRNCTNASQEEQVVASSGHFKASLPPTPTPRQANRNGSFDGFDCLDPPEPWSLLSSIMNES